MTQARDGVPERTTVDLSTVDLEQVDLSSLKDRDLVLLQAMRPKKGWIGLMVRGLGPLPLDPIPKRWMHAKARRFRVTPVLLAIFIYAAAIFMTIQVPHWMGSTLLSGAGEVVSGAVAQGTGQQASFDGSWLNVGVLSLVVLIAGIALVRVGPKGVYNFFFDAAMDEEVMFRYGSELWTPWQRIRSCLQFSVAHLMNLVVAVVTLGILALAGAVFMVIYITETRRTGNRQAALVTAAHFHATYNVSIMVLLSLQLGLFFLASFLVATMG